MPNKVKDAWSKLARPSSEEDKVYGQEENLPITGGEDNYPRWNSARQQHRRVLRGVLAIAFISCCLASFLAGRSFDVRKQCSDSSDGVSTATDISLMARGERPTLPSMDVLSYYRNSSCLERRQVVTDG